MYIKKRYFIAKVLIFCVVEILFLSYNCCSFLGSFPWKIVFTIFYICEMEKTHPMTAALSSANRFILFYRKPVI